MEHYCNNDILQGNDSERIGRGSRSRRSFRISNLFQIVLPLSAPIIAVMSLFYGVGHWNQYFNGLIFLTDRELFPLQLILREIINTAGNATELMMQGGNVEAIGEQARIASVVKYAVMIVSAAPLLIVYPFLQRFFLKGVLIGSSKRMNHDFD